MALLGLVGAYLSAGGFTTAFGWAVASLAANQIFKQRIEGPRLNDLSVQTSEPGQPIPIVFGTVRLAGNVIWSTGLKETKNTESGGKGKGPEQINYKYSTSLAILLGEESDQLIQVIANNKMIYDYNGGDQKGFVMTHDAPTGSWSSTGMRYYTGTDTQLPDPLIEASEGVGRTPAFRGRSYVVLEDFQLEDYGNTVPTFLFVFKRNINNVETICQYLVNLVEVDSGDTDFSALSDYTIPGFVVQDRDECRHYLEFFQRMYFCRFCEYDWKIQCRSLVNNNSILTLTADEIGFVRANDQRVDISEVSAQTLEIPYRIEFSYLDATKDYNINMQPVTRQVTKSRKKEAWSAPAVMNGAQAKQIAQTDLVTRWTERKKYDVNLGIRHLWLVANDVITVPTGNGLIDMRIEDCNKQIFGPMVSKLTQHDTVSYSQPLLNAPGITLPPKTVPTYVLPRYVAADCPPFRDTDTSQPGFYFGVGAPYGELWNEANLSGVALVGSDTGKAWKKNENIVFQSTIGVAGTAIGNQPAGTWDNTSSLVVYVVAGPNGGVLNSVPEDSVTNGQANALLVGSEILQFVNAVDNGSTVIDGMTARQYTLSKFMRGRLGTDMFVGTHVDGEQVMLLDSTVTRFNIQDIFLNTSQTYTLSYGSGSTTTFDFTVAGNSLKPLPVINVEGLRYAAPDLHWAVQWQNQARMDGDTDPLPPDLDAWEIDVLDGSFNVVNTYKTSTVAKFPYAKSMQITDFGSPQSTLNLDIYRMSAKVGRGYKTRVALS